ncbi:MAG TPA: class I adenylate-forming enzyme family protein [Streptosporangiaceae bacterium]|nr:class I adenylate-forming enzyme family protein [Streptosporangiaceae bacterium]
MIDELARALRRDSDRPAVVGVSGALNGRLSGRGAIRTHLTRGQLSDLAESYAGALHHRGLGDGDTLGVAIRPGGRSLAVLLAARKLGLRVAALDPTAGPDVLRARIKLASPSLVLADAAAQAVASWARPLARRAQLELPALDEFGPVLTVGRRLLGCAPSLERALAGRTGTVPDRSGQDGDAVIIFTSGTTARPRAVVHTWASVDAGMRAVTGLVGPLPSQPVLGGTLFVLVPALACGAPVALPSRSAAGVARQLDRLAPQATYLTPPVLRAALDAGARFTGRVYSGSAPVSATLLGRLKAAGAEAAYGVYALTEMFPVAAVEAAQKAAFDGPGDLVGRLADGVRSRVDASGQLLLAGPNACDRYLGEPSMDWVQTGDQAVVRGDQVVLAGRSKDMILRAAENIYPGLYEPALHVPGVSLAILVGVPAEDQDELVAAVVELEPGADRAAVRTLLRPRLESMGSARPDLLLFAPVPLSGRSRKPDRAAASELVAARQLAAAPELVCEGRRS